MQRQEPQSRNLLENKISQLEKILRKQTRKNTAISKVNDLEFLQLEDKKQFLTKEASIQKF